MDEQKTFVRSGAKACTNCGEILQLTAEQMCLRTGFLMEALEVDIYTCPSCGKVELYCTPKPQPEPKELVTCPKCGAQHSKYINCPNCMIDRGLPQIERNIGQQKKREKEKKTKDPWNWK